MHVTEEDKSRDRTDQEQSCICNFIPNVGSIIISIENRNWKVDFRNEQISFEFAKVSQSWKFWCKEEDLIVLHYAPGMGQIENFLLLKSFPEKSWKMHFKKFKKKIIMLKNC